MAFDPDHALLGISVASEMTGVDAQMLRAYEARGLVSPHRTEGGTRRYSENDLERVDHITELLGEGLNLAGVAAVLELEAEARALQAENDSLRARAVSKGK